MPTLMSDKQLAFIKTLANEREWENAEPSDWEVSTRSQVQACLDGCKVSKYIASDVITYLLSKPKKGVTQASSSGALTAGMYMLGGEVYKVQKAVHGSGNLYAKHLSMSCDDSGNWTGKFEYAPGVIKKLTIAERMTPELAKTFGALYGTCCVCGATLTDEKSIAAGIGPVCAGKI